MSDQVLSIVLLSAWLVLALSSLASLKLSWSKGITMALIWGAIFTGVALLITAVRG
jgi:hypothetical protein